MASILSLNQFNIKILKCHTLDLYIERICVWQVLVLFKFLVHLAVLLLDTTRWSQNTNIFLAKFFCATKRSTSFVLSGPSFSFNKRNQLKQHIHVCCVASPQARRGALLVHVVLAEPNIRRCLIWLGTGSTLEGEQITGAHTTLRSIQEVNVAPPPSCPTAHLSLIPDIWGSMAKYNIKYKSYYKSSTCQLLE